MKSIRIGLVLFFVTCGALAWAHARLLKAVPADGSVVTVAPKQFVLTFGEPARLTVLSLRKDPEAAKKLGPLPTSPAAEISVPVPPLAPGKYVLSWRAVGDDGHVVPGQISFTVGPQQ